MARAINSLPVPVSPSSRTVEALGATVSTNCNVLERGAAPYDLLEIDLTTDFLFKIELLLSQLVLELGNLPVCQRVFNCDCYLPRGRAEEINVFRSKQRLSRA